VINHLNSHEGERSRSINQKHPSDEKIDKSRGIMPVGLKRKAAPRFEEEKKGIKVAFVKEGDNAEKTRLRGPVDLLSNALNSRGWATGRNRSKEL